MGYTDQVKTGKYQHLLATASSTPMVLALSWEIQPIRLSLPMATQAHWKLHTTSSWALTSTTGKISPTQSGSSPWSALPGAAISKQGSQKQAMELCLMFKSK